MNTLATMRRLAAAGMKGSAYTTGTLRIGGTGGTPNSGDWLTNPTAGNRLSRGTLSGAASAITRINWDTLTGSILSCPAVQACINYVWRNSVQAPWAVERKVGGEWKSAEHPILDMLRFPTPIHDATFLDMAIKLSLLVNGNAYIVQELTDGGDVAEMWWIPHHWVEPYTAQGNNPFVVDAYIVDLGQQRIPVPPERMIHVKYGTDDCDPRLGISPWWSAAKDVNTLQQLGSYRPDALRNNGHASKIISSKDPNTPPDPVRLKEIFDSKTQGSNQQSTIVLDFPADIVFPGVSPKDMEIGAFGDVPEADICALIGLPPQVVGLHVGRLSKTYANMKEAREEAWEGCLMPLDTMINGQLGTRLLPMGLKATDRMDPVKMRQYLGEWRLTCDYSQVRPLQPDLDALHGRAREDFKVGLITLGEWAQIVGRKMPDKALADLRFSDLNSFGGPQTEDPNNPDGNGDPVVTGKAWFERMDDEIKRTHSLLAAAERNGRH